LTDQPADARRLCPTRANGVASLIAHWITPATCLQRQRSNYHKCFTCRYQGLGANATLPTVKPLAPVPLPPPPVIAPNPTRRRGRVKVSRVS
jgi:hypothetical protein